MMVGTEKRWIILQVTVCSSPLKTVCRRYTSRVMMHLWEPYFVQVFSTIEMLIIFRSAHQPCKMTFDSSSSDYLLPSTKVWAPNSILNFSQKFGMRHEVKSLELCFNHSYLFQIWRKSARLVAEFFKNQNWNWPAKNKMQANQFWIYKNSATSLADFFHIWNKYEWLKHTSRLLASYRIPNVWVKFRMEFGAHTLIEGSE